MDFTKIPSLEEAEALVNSTITQFLRKYAPNYTKIIKAEVNTTVPAVPYISVKVNNSYWINRDPRGNVPLYSDLTSNVKTYVYENRWLVRVKFHKGEAFSEATRTLQKLTMNEVWYETFGIHNPYLGLLGNTGVRKENIPIDRQEWEQGAVFTFDISTLSKETIELENIENVTSVGGIRIKVADKVITEDIDVKPPYIYD